MKESTLLLTQEQKQICYGTLLGDCSVSLNGKNARLQMHHGPNQYKYIYWKYKKFESFCTRKGFQFKPTDKNSFSKRFKIRLQTRNSPDVTTIYHLLINKGLKVVTREYLELLDPLSIAVWWCDDGALTGGRKQAMLCTHNMTFNEVEIIQTYFKEKWNLHCTIGTKESPATEDKIYYFLTFYTKNAEKFLKLIVPFIPVKSMIYKTFLQFNTDEALESWNSYLSSQYVNKFFTSEKDFKEFMQKKATR